MPDVARRGLEQAGSYAAAGAVIGSFIPGIGTLIGAGVGALIGGVSGAMGANEENSQLSSAEELAKKAINEAAAKLEAANAEQKAALEEFINGQKSILGQVQARKKQLAEEVEAAERGGIDREEQQIEQGYAGLRGALKQQEGGLDVVRQLQLEGVRQREALLGTEETAARRITAPGGLLERQQQQNALARAQAMQKARLGGPAARAALMGQFATQGAQLGMQAQQDIADAQRRVREGRMGLIGEQTSAELERQRGLMDIYGRRGELTMDEAKSGAAFTGRRTGAEVARLQGLSEADVGYQTGLGDLQAQRYNTLTDLRNQAAGRSAEQTRDLADAQMARLAREQELNAAASQRNVGLIQSAMGLAAANPKALGSNFLPDWASGLGGGGGGGGGDAGLSSAPFYPTPDGNLPSMQTSFAEDYGAPKRGAGRYMGQAPFYPTPDGGLPQTMFTPESRTTAQTQLDPFYPTPTGGPNVYRTSDQIRKSPFYPTPLGNQRAARQYNQPIGPGLGSPRGGLR